MYPNIYLRIPILDDDNIREKFTKHKAATAAFEVCFPDISAYTMPQPYDESNYASDVIVVGHLSYIALAKDDHPLKHITTDTLVNIFCHLIIECDITPTVETILQFIEAGNP